MAVLPLSSRNVLVCLRYGIGDLVMELPALTALREALPDATITGIATAPSHELLEGDPRVDRIVLASRWGLHDRWDRGNAAVRERIGTWVVEQEFDLVLDAAHAIEAVGRAIWSQGITSLESSPGEESRTLQAGHSGVAAIRAGVRAGWGLDVPGDVRPELRVRPEDRAFAIDLLSESGAGDDAAPFAISPVASHEMKRWPVERFAAVADHVLERGYGPVLVLEGPQPEEGRRVLAAMQRPEGAIRVGPHPLLRTAALLERCDALVCNDTGLMHVSAAVGTRTVAVFGPTRAQAFLPPGQRTVGVEPAGLECPHRETTSLFPPSCWQEGECLIGPRSCVHQTALQDVRAAVDDILERGSEASSGSGRRPGRRPEPAAIA